MDAPAIQAVGTVSSWAQGRGYRRSAVDEFLGSADLYLIGHALAHRHTVVTLERASNEITKVKIPNACVAVGVPHVNTLDMLRRERVRFVLDARDSAT